MNVKALQRADRLFGVPLCFGLTCLRVVLDSHISAPLRPLRSILFIKLAEQGSTVLAYPALQRAVELVGRQNVYFLAFEENRFILDAMRVIPEANVITVSAKNVVRFLWDLLRGMLQLRRSKVQAAIDLEFFARGSAALSFLSGAAKRVGFHAYFGGGPYRGNLMTHRLIYNPHLPTSQAFLMLVETLLCEPATLPASHLVLPTAIAQPPQFVPRTEELARVREMLGWQSGDHWQLVLLNPNSGDLLPLRRWPGERYVELARRLLARHPQVFVAFTGALAEATATAKLVRQVASDRCLSLAGKTTLRQLLALYDLAEVLVTNDSGPAHFAALTRVRVVTLFGPETPDLFAARTSRNRVLWAKLPCSPCVSVYNNRQSPCRNNLCLQAISVDQVFSAVCCFVELNGQFPNAVSGMLARETSDPNSDPISA